MSMINYVFDGDDFEYSVTPNEAEQRVFEWLCDNWTHEECAAFIVGLVDLFEDFRDVIEDSFRDEAEEFYYECKNSDD